MAMVESSSNLDRRQKLIERTQQLKDRQQRLMERNRELKRKLAQARSAIRSPTSLREETPMFFVVELRKSGTSWLMRTLDGHPEILCRGEGRFFGREWKRSPKQIQGRRLSSSRRPP